MADLNDTRAEPASNTPASYESQLELDVRSAFDTTENAPAPADKGSERQYNRDDVGRFAKAEGDGKGQSEGSGSDRKGNRDNTAGQDGSISSEERRAPGVAEGQDQQQGQSGADRVDQRDEVERPAGDVAEEPGTEAPPAQAQVGNPPPGWSVASKAAWEALPDHIRADVVKREGEVAQGLAALREYKDIKPYAEQARQSGTTLAAALQRYTTMEGTMRRDPANGMVALAQNIGLSKAQAAELFADVAQKLGAKPIQQPQPPNQTGGGSAPQVPSGSHQDDPLMAVLGPLIEQRLGPLEQQFEQRLGPLAQKLGAFETHLTRQFEADQNARSQSVTKAIETFAADPKNRYFPDLEETISRLFETGTVQRTADPVSDLQKAYDMAAYLHPEVREVLINERLKTKTEETKAKEQQVAARAQAASRSITGSASSGTDAAPKGKRKGLSYEADLEADVRAAMENLVGRA